MLKDFNFFPWLNLILWGVIVGPSQVGVAHCTADQIEKNALAVYNWTEGQPSQYDQCYSYSSLNPASSLAFPSFFSTQFYFSLHRYKRKHQRQRQDLIRDWYRYIFWKLWPTAFKLQFPKCIFPKCTQFTHLLEVLRVYSQTQILQLLFFSKKKSLPIVWKRFEGAE